jgi:Fe-S-cluster-containing hydrogenase component 2
MGRIRRIVTNKKICRDCQACELGCSLFHEKESNLQSARLRSMKNVPAAGIARKTARSMQFIMIAKKINT